MVLESGSTIQIAQLQGPGGSLADACNKNEKLQDLKQALKIGGGNISSSSLTCRGSGFRSRVQRPYVRIAYRSPSCRTASRPSKLDPASKRGSVRTITTWLFVVPAHLQHDASPRGVHVLEGHTLFRDLLHDLLSAKDGLQVQPLALGIDSVKV